MYKNIVEIQKFEVCQFCKTTDRERHGKSEENNFVNHQNCYLRNGISCTIRITLKLKLTLEKTCTERERNCAVAIYIFKRLKLKNPLTYVARPRNKEQSFKISW